MLLMKGLQDMGQISIIALSHKYTIDLLLVMLAPSSVPPVLVVKASVHRGAFMSSMGVGVGG